MDEPVIVPETEETEVLVRRLAAEDDEAGAEEAEEAADALEESATGAAAAPADAPLLQVVSVPCWIVTLSE